MAKLVYKVVRHDGGWAYEVDGTFSEPFRTREAARIAAKTAAAEQSTVGETTAISYEDDQGHWHDEIASGKDRPKPVVEG